MAHADALTFREPRETGPAARWAAAGVVVLAAHAGVWFVLTNAPPPAGVVAPPAIEMDLVPPPSGEAQTVDAGATVTSAASEAQTAERTPDEAEPVETPPEELPELTNDEPPPPPDVEAVTADTPPETVEAQDEPVEAAEIPPDVTPAVALPPEETVVAREERREPRREVRRPEPRREVPRREIVRREPRPETPRAAPTARRETQASASSRAGGASGAAATSGAARASAADYGRRLNALIAAQKRYPAGAQGARGRAVIAFTVSRGGRVVRQSIAASSGNAALDQELQAMLRRASPSFPAMPPELPGATKSFTLPMTFSYRG